MRIQLRDGGRVDELTGYGQFNRSFYLTLPALGHQVGCDKQPLPDADVDLFICPPYGFKGLKPERCNVAITMTERESVAGYRERFDWVGLCNQMDMVITPSEWNRQVFLREGVTVPMAVMPMGTRTDFWTTGRPYRFVSSLDGLGSHSSRWNWQELLDAYVAAFPNGEEVEWLILARGGIRKDFTRQNPAVRILVELQTEAQMLAHYRDADCYLSYSREGWGCPQWEALACGLEVIVPDYGVQGEWLKGLPQVSTFPAGHLSADDLKYEGGDLAALSQALREAYQRGRAGILMARQLDYRIVSTRLVALLQGAIDRRVAEQTR